jgi:hypothetical protein
MEKTHSCSTCGYQWEHGQNGSHSCITTLQETIDQAISLAVRYGGIDEAHHKAWTIDQMFRILAGDKYSDIVKNACDGEDGPNTYSWDCGIAP